MFALKRTFQSWVEMNGVSLFMGFLWYLDSWVTSGWSIDYPYLVFQGASPRRVRRGRRFDGRDRRVCDYAAAHVLLRTAAAVAGDQRGRLLQGNR